MYRYRYVMYVCVRACVHVRVCVYVCVRARVCVGVSVEPAARQLAQELAEVCGEMEECHAALKQEGGMISDALLQSRQQVSRV